MSQVIESTGVLTEVSIESVLLDADLFVKYSSAEKAFKLLHDSLERSPRSIALREKLRDICIKTAHLWREYNPNVPVLPPGFADFTQYLLQRTFTFTNFNNTVRTYRFWLGPTFDTSGL